MKSIREAFSYPNYSGEAGLGPFIGLAVILVILPVFLSSYMEGIMARFLIYAILAMSYNVAFGYAGLLSLGHAAFFGTGGYVVGLLTLHGGIDLFWISFPLGIICATAVAAIFGIIALRARGIYFLLVTFALGQLLFSLAWNVDWMSTRGMQGISGLSRPAFGIPGYIMSDTQFYYLVLGFFLVSLVLLYRLVNSPFGLSLIGIREDEGRMEAAGYNTWLHKYIAFVVSGAFAGMAGVLFAYYNYMISPWHLSVSTSFLPMVMAIIGGQATLLGPAIGAAFIILVEHNVSMFMPTRWPIVLGGLFVLSIMFARQGIWVYVSVLLNKVSRGNERSNQD
jgi:branched-chain amino acid transport system permease protein